MLVILLSTPSLEPPVVIGISSQYLYMLFVLSSALSAPTPSCKYSLVRAKLHLHPAIIDLVMQMGGDSTLPAFKTLGAECWAIKSSSHSKGKLCLMPCDINVAKSIWS